MSSEGPRDKTRPRLRLRITARAETIIRSGHPWLFAESILEQNRAGDLGEIAVVYDRRDRFLALGFFDPDSPLRVRVLHRGQPVQVDAEWWKGRFERALEKRRLLFDERTTGFRWINGESDGWPGLVLDTYGGTVVLKLYTSAWLPWLEQVIQLVRAQLSSVRIVLRLSRNIQDRVAGSFGRADGEVIWGQPLDGPVIFQETGLRFEAEVLRGQKTGFFLDQRENRRHVEALAVGRRVLNAFSFSGGFSLYAARGGARSVTDVDISPHALAASRRNFGLNQSVEAVARCRHDTIQADVFEWLALGREDSRPVVKGRGLGGENSSSPRKGGLFDLVILDPPSLAKREIERAGAIRAYGRLATLGLGHLTEAGIMVACSCSAHVSATEFFEVVEGVARLSKRPFRVLQTTLQPADHPASFPEAKYLKAIYLELRRAC